MARPSKFNEVKDYLIEMAKLGLTDQQMADVVGVTEQTINNWKANDKAFFESLKESKAMKDENVVKSLFERAMGYECLEDKIFNDNGTPLVVPTVKQYPPDPTSMIFWLKNRQPDKWRDKQEVVNTNVDLTATMTKKEKKERLRELMDKAKNVK